MFGIKIEDKTPGGCLSFGLADVVNVIGEPALRSEWRCFNLRYIAAKDEIWDEWSEKRRRFSGEEFVDFAERVGQVIDGEFIPKQDGSNKAWLVIKSGRQWVVRRWSSKPKVLDEMKRRFVKVSSLSNGGVEHALGADSPQRFFIRSNLGEPLKRQR